MRSQMARSVMFVPVSALPVNVSTDGEILKANTNLHSNERTLETQGRAHFFFFFFSFLSFAFWEQVHFMPYRRSLY